MTRPAKKPRASRSGPSGSHKAPRIALTVDAVELDAWRALATKAGLTLADWIRGAVRVRAKLAGTASPIPGVDYV